MIDKKITFEYKIINNWYDAGTSGIFDQDINKKCKYFQKNYSFNPTLKHLSSTRI